MTGKPTTTHNRPGGGKAMDRKRGSDWRSGLKQLYDSVVEEPIPESFKDLLSKLDDKPK